jgi:cystathionine beta-lyase
LSREHSNFDRVIDRRGTNSTKWEKFGPDVLPMWVADMDFAAPDFIIEGLARRLEHPILGYTARPASLQDAFLGWLAYHYNWNIPADWVVWLPGVVPGLNLAAQTLDAGEAIMIPTPVYHPFLDLAEHAGLTEIRVPMQCVDSYWSMDFEAMEAALTPATRMVLICNPQNPTGRCYTHDELKSLAEFVERHDLLLVSDEIHCNLILDPDARHIPFAQAFPELTARTISLYSATKVYNIPGVSCAAAVIPDEACRLKFLHARKGLVPGIGPLGFAASELAFNDRSSWIRELTAYLRQNQQRIHAVLGPRVARQEATYLAWINVGDLKLPDAEAYFAAHGLGLNPGQMFGAPDYVRLNFGCPRVTLNQGLELMLEACAEGH